MYVCMCAYMLITTRWPAATICRYDRLQRLKWIDGVGNLGMPFDLNGEQAGHMSGGSAQVAVI